MVDLRPSRPCWVQRFSPQTKRTNTTFVRLQPRDVCKALHSSQSPSHQHIAIMKILMLHGYAQTGDTFRRKLHRLEASLRQFDTKAEFVYLDGPVKLETHDIPGSAAAYHRTADPRDEHDMRAWFDVRIVRNPPTGLHRSLESLAAVLKAQGPFDGIIAFSQGTIVGAMVASLLEGDVRRRAYEAALEQSDDILDYPGSFLDIRHPPLKFALFYASRVGTGNTADGCITIRGSTRRFATSMANGTRWSATRREMRCWRGFGRRGSDSGCSWRWAFCTDRSR